MIREVFFKQESSVKVSDMHLLKTVGQWMQSWGNEWGGAIVRVVKNIVNVDFIIGVISTLIFILAVVLWFTAWG
ncbi:hypothetical protein [Sphingobacterium yanglingense]|uniref:Uncharacterized protein n=1 Tax=Sphingobacterium yanglingense TaxID=1437280 RepID=A0A4R6WL63_9SPHI|nr:hypothetical protein [Sphingobacterium yanglingense]TDQ76601.1 hypothetical protein CLV99_3194 [Sphingobacterium yanglingense]